MADRNLIYKRNGQFAYSGIVDPYDIVNDVFYANAGTGSFAYA